MCGKQATKSAGYVVTLFCLPKWLAEIIKDIKLYEKVQVFLPLPCLKRKANGVLGVAADARVATEAFAQTSTVITNTTLRAHIKIANVVRDERESDVTIAWVPLAVSLNIVHDHERAVVENHRSGIGDRIMVINEFSGTNVDGFESVLNTINVTGGSVPALHSERILFSRVVELDESAHTRNVVCARDG